MTDDALRKDLNKVLRQIAAKLDIDASRYEKAKREYEELATWLNEKGTILSGHSPQIYPQGSFNLGTVVKPIKATDDFDIDLVCELFSISPTTNSGAIKKLVGDRLKQNPRYAKILREKNRCWRVNYPGDFHLDVLPAKPDEGQGGTAILIPDKELDDWTESDPRGYTKWFRGVMEEQFSVSRFSIAKSREAEPEEIPDYEVKTTLQQSVQLLKRSRDILFEDNPSNRPISVIITTLSGYSYRNQDDLFETLVSLVNDMPGHIQRINGVPYVANPINEDENFADKWQEHPEREEAFYKWIDYLQEKLNLLEAGSTISEAEGILKQLFGEELSSGALKEALALPPVAQSAKPSRLFFDAPHKKPLKWNYSQQYEVKLSAMRKAGKVVQGVMPRPYYHDGQPIAKWYSLDFTARTNAPEPYTVEWQVVNTGDEASNANGLRGDFYPSSGKDNHTFYRKENTQYTGKHWVEAFVIKGGICVGRSGEFIINIE